MKATVLRLARLERAGNMTPASYVVRLPTEAMEDGEAAREAIAEHRRRTGWTGWVVLAPARMTQSEWLARCGRAGGQ